MWRKFSDAMFFVVIATGLVAILAGAVLLILRVIELLRAFP